MIEPRPLLQHPRQERARDEEHRLHVDVERLVPVLRLGVEHRAVVHDAGAVEQNVDVADLLRRLGDGGLVGHVQHPRADAFFSVDFFQLLRR